MMRAICVLLAVCCPALALSGHVEYLLVDSRNDEYLRASSSANAAVSTHPSAVVAALIGAVPPVPVTASDAEEIPTIVKPSVFKKPTAHFMVTIAGLTTGELHAQEPYLFPGHKGGVSVQTPTESHPADHLWESHLTLAAANPGLHMSLLEQALEKACERDCSKQVHAMAADIFGASESSPEVLPLGSLLAAKGSCWETVQGAWMAPNPGTSCRVQPGQAVLNLKELGSPLLRSELAALHAGVMELVHEQRGEGAQDKEARVLGMGLLGLQDVQARYGRTSEQATLAKEAVRLALRWAVEQLDAALDGDITYQVAAVETSHAVTEDSLADWKASIYARARVLRAGSDTTISWWKDNEAAQSQKFAAKAAGYGSFLMILYFLLGATLCLCSMRNQKDTLLYGSKKSD